MRPADKNDRIRRTVKILIFALCAAFALVSLIRFAVLGKAVGVTMALLAAAVASLPLLVEKVFSCDIAIPLHLFVALYAPGPMLGNSYNLYYDTAWWDKLLHFSGGLLFALAGLYLILLINRKGSVSRLTRALFALFFSVTVAVIWEFVEFGADSFLGQDMQKDTIVTAFNSCLLGPGKGIMHHVGDIESVIVNGEVLPGYVDIGLIDSMKDLLIETAGALLVAAAFLIDRGKHSLIRQKNGAVPGSGEETGK